MKITRTLTAAVLAMAVATAALADRIELSDGSIINGKLLSAEAGKLKVETAFAGTIDISQSAVKTFSTDEVVNVGLAGGSTAVGKVSGSGDGIRVAASTGDVRTATTGVEAVWRPGDDSPATKKVKAEAAALVRKWAYEASAAITGRTGPSEKLNAAVGFKATLAGPSDKLIFALAAEQAEDNGVKTAERQFGGVDYSAFQPSGNGWYVRTSLEKDEIKGLDLRSLSAFGFSRKVLKKDYQDLELRLGASYLYETYLAGSDFESPGLDVTILHSYKFTYAKLNNMLTYTPTFEDFANYRINHESSLELPIVAARWRVKLGLNNQYQSKPPGGVDRLDTTYFTSLILNWE
ncbi:MAG TPA: DUF481 domain-containing protein [Lacunisphaera sp.]|nr:DUF481 domain-containing protein [Lacunisphaera sp.]